MNKLLHFLIATFIFSTICIANERIITLSPAVNEIVFALEKGDDIIANTEFCDYPEISKKLPKIGGYSSVSLEKLIKLNPSLVINQDYDKSLNKSLENLGFKTLVYKTNTLDDIRFAILDIGRNLNKEFEAKKLDFDIEKSLNSLSGIVENKKVLIVISPQNSLSSQIFVAGNFVYFEDIIKKSNNVNAFKSSLKSQPVINSEKIISLNPDIIVLLAPFLEDKKDVQETMIKMWEKLPINASRQKNIYIIDKLYAGIPSHRVKYFIDDYKEILEDVRAKELQ